MELEELRKKIVWIDECSCVFPKKYFTKEQAQEMMNYLEQPNKGEYKDWLDKISDEEFERRFHHKKSGNFKIIGEAHIRYKRVYEEPDYFGEVWSDEPYLVAYITKKLGRGAMPVWTCNYDPFWNTEAFVSYWEEVKNRKNRGIENG
jgi:hypothetical protein